MDAVGLAVGAPVAAVGGVVPGAELPAGVWLARTVLLGPGVGVGDGDGVGRSAGSTVGTARASVTTYAAPMPAIAATRNNTTAASNHGSTANQGLREGDVICFSD